MYTSSILQIFFGISICFSLVLRNIDDFMILRGWRFVPWNLKNIKNDSSPFSLLSSVPTYKHIQYIIISFKIIASLSKIEEIIIILQNMKSYPHPPFLYNTIPTYILTYPTFLVTQRKFRFISQIYLFLFFFLSFSGFEWNILFRTFVRIMMENMREKHQSVIFPHQFVVGAAVEWVHTQSEKCFN